LNIFEPLASETGYDISLYYLWNMKFSREQGFISNTGKPILELLQQD
jgi:hypothetical protein